MKRTNIVLDDKLVNECMKTTGIKTQRALIDHGPEDLPAEIRTFGTISQMG